jgi:hypothetical protein
VLEVVQKAHCDAADVRFLDRTADYTRGLAAQVEVVVREIEGRSRRRDELRDLVCDVEWLLASIAQRAYLQHPEVFSAEPKSTRGADTEGICDKLFLSPKTVESHVNSIFLAGTPSGAGRPPSRARRSRLPPRPLNESRFVSELARATIGSTFNQYAQSELRRERLGKYLASRRSARFLLVGEAAGYRGARVSGIPFTSERQLSGTGPAEATATIVQRTLRELDLEDDVVLWNVVPTHPHRPGTPESNRPPTRGEVRDGMAFLHQLAAGRSVIAVGRVAHSAVGGPYVRHPSHGGSAEFRAGLLLSIR